MSLARVTRRLSTTALLCLATVATVAACDTVTGGDDARAALNATDLLDASATADGAVRLRNLSGAAVYYFAADREALALLDWVPCTNPVTCDRVPARGEVTVPRSRIAADQPGSRSVVVYHWLLVPGGGGHRPDSIRATVVER